LSVLGIVLVNANIYIYHLWCFTYRFIVALKPPLIATALSIPDCVAVDVGREQPAVAKTGPVQGWRLASLARPEVLISAQLSSITRHFVWKCSGGGTTHYSVLSLDHISGSRHECNSCIKFHYVRQPIVIHLRSERHVRFMEGHGSGAGRALKRREVSLHRCCQHLAAVP
jgi:hypothetical protein